MLSASTIETIKALTPAVAANAETITRSFYTRMFSENPEVKRYFNEAHQHSGGQQRALAGAICAYFSNIENPGALGPAIELIAQKHCSLGIQPEHYPVVGKHLLAAIRDIMGNAVSDATMSAVAEAYQVLADVCINRERRIYREQRERRGGWNGYRTFVVDRKAMESRIVASFYLRPEDGGPLPDFAPGQYVTVRIGDLPETTSPRNYSLSDRPGTGYFRISVKREMGLAEGDPAGLVSNHLHDRVREGDRILLGPPCGEFTLDAESTADQAAVFLAGGIGVTPLLSMAKHLVRSSPQTPVHFFQAARNSDTCAFTEEIADLARESRHVRKLVMFDQPIPGDIETGKCDGVGTLTEALLREWIPDTNAKFYFCGPAPFMRTAYRTLLTIGVPERNVRFEFFGPRQEITGA